MSLPGEGPFDLFGDSITEDLHRILAVLAADQPEVIDVLFSNRSINEYVRWQAVGTYLHWVREGRWTRAEAVNRLRSHLRTTMQQEDHQGATGVAAELVSYSHQECYGEIEAAFRGGLVDRMVVDEKTSARSITEGEFWFQRQLRNLPPTGIQDTVAELDTWACYDESDQPTIVPRLHQTATFQATDWNAGSEERGLWPSPTTIPNDTARVGRNDPCPCGSGKKYKKCCGSRKSSA